MEDQTTTGSPGQAPGWDSDPYRRHELRYWDRDAWTDHVSDRGVTGVDPPDVMSPWAAVSTMPAANTPAPARPAGPSWAWQPSPTTAPPPRWGPLPGPAPPPLGAYPGVATVPTRRRRARWWVAAAVALVIVIIAGSYLILRPPSRIDAGPPAATPAGFRLVRTGDFRIAVPSAWQDRVVTSEDRDQIANRLDELAPGAGEKMDDAGRNVDGTMVVALDATGHENVSVVPFHWMHGDPGDPDTLAEIRGGIDGALPGATISGLTSAPADVHGYPAATLNYGITVGPLTIGQVASVIQTGDHVYEVTVTALSPERAADLSRQIVPTFDPA